MSESVYTHPRQFEFSLPAQSPDGLIHDRLAQAVEEFNASIDPSERIELHTEIVRLRGILDPSHARKGRAER